MLLRVDFKNKEFTKPVFKACAEILNQLARKGNGIDAFENYQKIKKEYEPERIRQSIIYATLGFLIVNKACDFYEKPDRNMLDQEFLLETLEKNIEIKEVEQTDLSDSDTTSCYIDFFNLRSFLAKTK